MRQAIRFAALSTSLFIALVVAALPGTTIASQTPARLIDLPAPSDPQSADDPLLLPVTLAELLPPDADSASLPPPEDVVAPPTVTPDTSRAPSVLAQAQIISVYGHPGFCVMGELGCHADPRDAVARARELAAEYDALNGDRATQAALHLIVDVAQANPGGDGRYLEQMSLDEIQRWVDLAREEGVVIFLDVQIGWSEVMTDVQRLGRFFEEPHVHLAIDPEFITKSDGLPPGQAIGELRAAEVNAVQEYLAGIVDAAAIPPKVLVLHQFREDMLPDADQFAAFDDVEVTIDMDGWGSPFAKSGNYNVYALAPYAERPAFKLFFEWDVPLMTPAEVLALPVPPDYVIYQ